MRSSVARASSALTAPAVAAPIAESGRPDALLPDVACITRDTVGFMSQVSIRELRNHGGDVVDRVASGEPVTITRSGKPVAEMRPVAARPKSLDVILANQRRLPPIDPNQFRDDIDRVLDPVL